MLPFANLSVDPENEYFCDGLAEELLNALTKVRKLRVVARTSAFSFKHQELDVREIARRLNVDVVLEGSVQKAGKRLRILTQLIDAANGYHLWSERFDRQIDDVFAIQDEIALAVVDKLKIELFADEKNALVKRCKESVDAYHHYLKGRHFWNQRFLPGAMQQAIRCFEQAIKLIRIMHWPTRVWPIAIICSHSDNFMLLTKYFPQLRGPLRKHSNSTTRWRKLVRHWRSCRCYTSGTGRPLKSGFKKAIELNPNYAAAHLWYAHYLCAMTRFDEAIHEVKQAQNFEPLSLSINGNVGLVLYWAREYNLRLNNLEKTIEPDRNFGLSYFCIGFPLLEEGRYEEAVASFPKSS